MKLSVVGLGKLGACSAACFAAKGFEVIGVDINREFIDAINEGQAPAYEPHLQELISSCQGRLKATLEYGKAINDSDITFLVVPTPSTEDGHFSDRYLQDALRHLALAFKNAHKKYHLFVVTSTVSPGTIEGSLIPLIDSLSGKRLHKDFGVCYNPAFIALGSVIRDFLNPDMVLIGESDKNAGDLLIQVYDKVCESKPYIARMSIVSSEITKLSLNSYITMKISFANTIANICERVKGADIDAITNALGADKRISSRYLRGGLSYGGPCFPRDNRAFAAFAMKHGVEAKLAMSTDEVNKLQINRLAELVVKNISKNDNSVSILGLAYKPCTNVIEGSPSIKLIEGLLKRDIKIMVYDQLAMESVRAYFGDDILYAGSVRDCLSYAPLCVIAAQAEEFKRIDESHFTHNPSVLIDCWRILDPSRFSKKIKYISVGKLQGQVIKA